MVDKQSRRRRTAMRMVLLLTLGTAILGAVAFRRHLDVDTLRDHVAAFGAWAPLVFVGLYALGTVLFLPAMIFALAGGLLFGPMWGTVFNLAGAALGATVAFLAARYVLSGWVEQRIGGRLARLVEGIEAEGWRFVAFVRLVPLFPFNLLNYALGITRIPLAPYVVTTIVCMVPGAIAYTYIGHAGGEALGGGDGLVQKALLGLGLLAAAAFLPRLVMRLRKGAEFIAPADLKESIEQAEDLVVLDVRGSEEYSGPLGHIEGALHIPLADLPGRLGEVVAPAGAAGGQVVVVCRAEKKSRAAAGQLRKAGVSCVSVVRGGMEAWNEAGYPVVR